MPQPQEFLSHMEALQAKVNDMLITEENKLTEAHGPMATVTAMCAARVQFYVTQLKIQLEAGAPQEVILHTMNEGLWAMLRDMATSLMPDISKKKEEAIGESSAAMLQMMLDAFFEGIKLQCKSNKVIH